MDQSLHAKVANLKTEIVATGLPMITESRYESVQQPRNQCIKTTNRIPVRTAVSLLAARVMVLSQLILKEGCEVPEMNRDDQDTLVAILQNFGIPYQDLQIENYTINSIGPSPSSYELPGSTIMKLQQSVQAGGSFLCHKSDMHSLDELSSSQISLDNAPKDDLTRYG